LKYFSIIAPTTLNLPGWVDRGRGVTWQFIGCFEAKRGFSGISGNQIKSIIR